MIVIRQISNMCDYNKLSRECYHYIVTNYFVRSTSPCPPTVIRGAWSDCWSRLTCFAVLCRNDSSPTLNLNICLLSVCVPPLPTQLPHRWLGGWRVLSAWPPAPARRPPFGLKASLSFATWNGVVCWKDFWLSSSSGECLLASSPAGDKLFLYLTRSTFKFCVNC